MNTERDINKQTRLIKYMLLIILTLLTFMGVTDLFHLNKVKVINNRRVGRNRKLNNKKQVKGVGILYER